ncbi:hypothetical protein [Pseudarthrobacter defluvii]|uniref:hypothetical protein n=1 Tax=Pseudarthrobacter defluvii TaxID=410837 RepID=UPI0027D83E03|nr:hypothetical protein [Pseudarthrobacter defluvii]
MHPLSGRSRTGGEAPHAYRYQGPPKPDPAAARTREVLALLAQQRRMLALRSSRVRDLANELHERVAQAVCDGAKAAAVAKASGMLATAVRSVALAREELYPSGQGRAEQLRLIAELAADLAAAADARGALEQKRTEVLAMARKSRLLDDYQLAAASGLKSDEIRKMTRGVGLRVA